MPLIPILKIGRTAEQVPPPRLAGYTPALPLEGLQVGVDNLRHDVYLSPRFIERVRLQIARLITRHGDLEELMTAEAPPRAQRSQFVGSAAPVPVPSAPGASELKPLLAKMHEAALNRAKAAQCLSVDTLVRLAIIKFLRAELSSQFALLLERGRMMLKNYEGLRAQKAIEYRERFAAFQVAKKIILRKAGQDLFRILRELEKETLARTRRSLFGERGEAGYKLFLNPLIFSEDGRDAYLSAEHYVMLGNFERDPDRFANARRVVCEFLQFLNVGPQVERESALERWLNAPENAQELVGAASSDDSKSQGKAQKVRLAAWVELLERERLMDHVVASYEVVPLLAEYSPRINAQQLKNALISKEERARVERLIQEHGKLSTGNLAAAAGRVASCRGPGRAKMAGRFLRDFLRYHRDMRRLEVLNEALDSVNLVSTEKIRELSAINGTLYELLLSEEQESSEEKVLRHVVLKADIRDSSRLTRSLLERGMNPASYFSLNFYEPVNKLLPKYGASKVFLEGDAIILALLEHEGEVGLPASRACVLAREIIEIVRGYNQLLERASLPTLELGIGISFQDSAPMYLTDGEQRIMISDALNESDRMSSCSKRLRRSMERLASPFSVYSFQSASDEEMGEFPDDFVMNYNLNGIRMNQAAFHRLEQEISLQPCRLDLPQLWGSEDFRLYTGLVPLGGDIFRRIVVRTSQVPQINARDFSLRQWTDRRYYEVCSNPAVYALLDAKAAAGK